MGNKIRTFDITLPLIPVLLTVVGISVIYSLVFGTADSELAFKQGMFALLGLGVMFLVSFFDYRFFRGTSWILYIVSVLLLIYVDFFGKIAGGAARWIDLGFFQLQPSEVAKVSLILSLGSFFSSRIGKILWKDIALSLGLLVPPLILILKEPDLGTALVVVFIYIVMFFAAKPQKIQALLFALFFTISASAIILAALNITPFKSLLHDYQRNRILIFVDPNLDPYGRGYNVRQAQITIGSGGLFGKGLGHGSQSQLQFLPKPQTDFIFSGIAESFGFFGVCIYLSLYVALILKIISIAHLARDNFGMMIAFGAAAMFLFQVMINVGMNSGLAPVTGIPLPFASYGGTALVVYYFIVGLSQSVFIRHKKISF